MVVREYQVCTNCVMDTSDSNIVFDENGVCDHCRDYYTNVIPNWHTDEKGQKVIDDLARKIKQSGEGKDFDCIIGMSGGVDSSYLVYLAKKRMNLRPLVFHVDAGWNSQQAVNNIERIVDGLGLHLYTEVIDWPEMRDLQLAFFKSGVPQIDAPQDNSFFATMYKFAEENGVKYILTGANLSTECVQIPLEWMWYQSDYTLLNDIHKKFGTRPLVKFPKTSILRHKVYLPYVKGIKVIRPLDHIPYVKQEAISLLVEKFGWQPYARKHFESRFTQFYEGFWLYKKFGYDTRRVYLTNLILSKQMTRDDALAELAKPPFNEETIAHDFEYIATKLAISVDELQALLEAPNKSYKDYKSQENLYLWGARIMKSLGLARSTRR